MHLTFWICGRLGKSHSPPQIKRTDLVAFHQSIISEIGHVAHSGRATLKNNTSRISTSATRKFISSSFAGGRWDQMVLNAKALTGNPHTAVFKDMWKGWSISIRTISQAISKNLSPSGHRRRRKALIFEHPPPL